MANRNWLKHDGAGKVSLGSGYASIDVLCPVNLSSGAAIQTLVASNSSYTKGLVQLSGNGNVTVSYNASTILISAAGAAGGAAISAGTQSVASGTVIMSNSNGVTFGMAGSQTITASYTAPVVSNQIQGVGSATGSGTNTSVFAAVDHVHSGIYRVSLGGNTDGNTSAGPGSVHIVGGNNVTLSCATAAGGETISIIGAAAGTGAGINAVSGGTTLVTSGTVSFKDTNGVSFGVDGQTITASVSAAAGVQHSFLEAGNLQNLTTVVNWNATGDSDRPYVMPFIHNGTKLSLKTIRFLISRGAGTSCLGSISVGIYSAANSTSLALVSSVGQQYSLTTSAEFSGIRCFEFNGLSDMTLSAGHWWLALHPQASTGGGVAFNMRPLGWDPPSIVGSVHSGTDSTGATNASQAHLPLFGMYTTTTNAMPANIVATDLGGMGRGELYFYMGHIK